MRFFVLVLVLFMAVPAAAQEPLTLEGREGVWLPLESAREALRARMTEPYLREQLDLRSKELALAQAEIDLLLRGLDLGKASERALFLAVQDGQEALAASQRAADLQERRARRAQAWAVGLGAGVAVALLGMVLGLVL